MQTKENMEMKRRGRNRGNTKSKVTTTISRTTKLQVVHCRLDGGFFPLSPPASIHPSIIPNCSCIAEQYNAEVTAVMMLSYTQVSPQVNRFPNGVQIRCRDTVLSTDLSSLMALFLLRILGVSSLFLRRRPLLWPR